MQIGVSPVVATVLLVAIAVISSISVWYWTSFYTVKQGVSDASTKAFTVAKVFKNLSGDGCNAVDLKNNGGNTINNVVYQIRYLQNGTPLNAYVNITAELIPGATLVYNISTIGNASNRTSIPLGHSYIMRATKQGYSDRILTCA